MMKFLVLFILSLLAFAPSVFAKSDYVLPYPSAMPGSIFYKLNLIKGEILKHWYFGDFGQFKYYLKQSDKYLVEAKTLFEYKQYLLGYNALHKSDKHFEKTYPHILSAKNNGKNISDIEKILKSAAKKHVEELIKIKKTVPSAFEWTPERDSPTVLRIWKDLDKSIKQREARL